MAYRGLACRALNPVYAADPLSGRGAELFGGRFNARGAPALYTSLAPETAIREANQVGMLQPTMLIAYRIDIEAVFDTRHEDVSARYDLSSAELVDTTWRDRMKCDGRAPIQELPDRLKADGFAALLVRSFAAGTTLDDMNLVIWSWTGSVRSRVVVIDDDNRLPRAR